MQIDKNDLRIARKIAEKEQKINLREPQLERDIREMLKTESGRLSCPFCQTDDTKRNKMYAIIKNNMFFCFRCRQRRSLR